MVVINSSWAVSILTCIVFGVVTLHLYYLIVTQLSSIKTLSRYIGKENKKTPQKIANLLTVLLPTTHGTLDFRKQL